MEKDIKSLILSYWIIIICTIAISVFYYIFAKTNQVEIATSCSTTLQSLSLLLMLTALPIALRLFHIKTQEKNLPKDVDEHALFTYIKQWFLCRLSITMVVYLITYVSYILIKNESMLICCGIIWIFLLFFCKPNKAEILDLIQKNK